MRCTKKKTALVALPVALAAAAAALPLTLANAATTTPWSVHINAGGAGYTDPSGQTWIADQYFIGGAAAANTHTIANTDNPTAYATERYGMSGYKIPVPAAGFYDVTLRMAETWATTAGQRVFSATAEGNTVVSNLDLVKVVGADTAYDVTFTVKSGDSNVDLGFSASVNNAMVKGIEVVARKGNSTPTSSPTASPTASPTTSPTASPSPSASPTTSPSAPTSTDPWPLVGTKNLYVSASGSDSNPGTSSAPFRQVSKAASVATAGTIVHVGPGTYGYVESVNSGTQSAPITFVSDSKWGAKIYAPGSTNAWTNTGQWVVIQNFDITGSKYSGIMSTASNDRFLGNHIHDMAPPDCSRGGAGIELQNYSETNVDSIGNVIHNIKAPVSSCGLIHGIYYQGPYGGRILNNLVYDTSGWGIHLWHNANHVYIANNTVFRNTQGGMVIGGSLEGNDIAPGIDSGTVVTNNVVVNNGYWGIREMGRVGVNTYANNLLYGNASGAYSLSGGGVPTGTVTADPQFVNYSGGDYHVKTTSPVIDKGTSQQAPSYDLDLVGRPQGSTFDIGAYEGGR